MTPRAYSQEKRAASAAATRARIREAAIELYRERGIAPTTIVAIAERADVARGTVLHHFGSADGLLDAVLDEFVPGLHSPDEHVQDGIEREEERVRRYVDAMFRFFVRSEDIWPIVSRDMEHPVLKAREAEYLSTIGRLYAATFRDLAADRIVAGVVRAYVNYGPLNDLRAAGLSLDELIELVADSLLDVVARRRSSVARAAP